MLLSIGSRSLSAASAARLVVALLGCGGLVACGGSDAKGDSSETSVGGAQAAAGGRAGGSGTGGTTAQAPTPGGGGSSPALGGAGQEAPATGGAPAGGGSTQGGSSPVGIGGGPASAGGTASVGGGTHAGGAAATGGTEPSGGTTATGGAEPSGGTTATAGAPVTGGAPSGGAPSGGAPSGGGTTATGGAVPVAGTAGSGGAIATVSSEGCGTQPTLQNGPGAVQSGNTDRTYILRLPDDYDNTHPYQLILSYHGATGNGRDVANTDFFGMIGMADGGTIFVAPDAIDGLWNADADVAFTRDLLAQLESDLCIDRGRIVIEGFSMGGAMTWTLACALPDVFLAAIVHGGGGLPVPESCQPIPYFSSLGHDGDQDQTRNSDFFAATDSCQVEALPGPPSGGHLCSNYQGCAEGYPVRWCPYDGGHTASPTDAGQGSSWIPEEVWSFLAEL